MNIRMEVASDWWYQEEHLIKFSQALENIPCLSHDDDTDAKMILTAAPAENWKRPPGRPREDVWAM